MRERNWLAHRAELKAMRAMPNRTGDGINEPRIHHGPGYRVYFQRRGNTLIILLCGGDKNTQAKDIKRAKRLAETWPE